MIIPLFGLISVSRYATMIVTRGGTGRTILHKIGMERAEVIRQLRALHESGVDIGTRLNVKTEIMIERLKMLSEASNTTGSLHVSEQSWQILLPQLNLRTMYRCLLLYRECNRAVGRNLIWPLLITRELGPIPSFTRNMKLYYLRGMNFGVPLNLYAWDESLPLEEQFREIATGVILIADEAPRYVRGNIIQPGVVLPYNVTIRKIFPALMNSMYLSTEGQLYDQRGMITTTVGALPLGEVIIDMRFGGWHPTRTTLLMKSGNVYTVVEEGSARRWALISIPEPIIDITSYSDRFVSQSGKLYQPSERSSDDGKITVEALPTPELADHTRWSIRSYENRPLESSPVVGSMTVLPDGHVTYKDSYSDPFPKTIKAEFAKYHLVSVYYDREEGKGAYLFRGFKRYESSEGPKRGTIIVPLFGLVRLIGTPKSIFDTTT